jgi:protein-S-isoprenylcysteine O-methyltransferase Ste14
MGDRSAGWGFVGAQFALLAVIILAPNGTLWELSEPVLWAVRVVIWLSLGIMVVAALGLGRGLTPVPLPNEHAQLRTGGFYHFVRHPIYSGLLLFAIAMALKSGSLLVLVASVALAVLINFKARWEESRLTMRFADYPAYAARTPRFVPGLRARGQH